LEPHRRGGGYTIAGAGAAAVSQSDAYGGRHWDSEPRRDGAEYATAGGGTAAGGPRSERWDVVPDNDGPAAALLELGIADPVATPVPGQPPWLSIGGCPRCESLFASMTGTACRHSLTSGKLVALFRHDAAVERAEVGPAEITAAQMEYACIGLDGVVPPCLETPRTRAKRFHAALRRVLHIPSRPFTSGSTAAAPRVVALAPQVPRLLERREAVVCLGILPRAFSMCLDSACGLWWRCRVMPRPRVRWIEGPSGCTTTTNPPPPPPRLRPAAATTQRVKRGRQGAAGQRRPRRPQQWGP